MPRTAAGARTPAGARTTAGARARAQSYATTILATPGLVGYWKLNEASGTTATDSSGAGHNGTAESAVVQAKPGIIGTDTAYQVANAVNNRVAIIGVGFDLTAGVSHVNTLECWCLWDGTNTVMLLSSNAANPYGLFFFNNTFGINTGVGDVYGVSSVGMKNRWCHIVACLPNATPVGNAALYINGVQQSISQKVGSSISAVPSSSLWVSGWGAGTTVNFSGRIAHVAAYNRQLSASEAQQHHLSARAAARAAVV